MSQQTPQNPEDCKGIYLKTLPQKVRNQEKVGNFISKYDLKD